MFGSGIIDWIYKLILSIVAYVTSWFTSGSANDVTSAVAANALEVEVNAPMMPTLLPDLSSSEEPLP